MKHTKNNFAYRAIEDSGPRDHRDEIDLTMDAAEGEAEGIQLCKNERSSHEVLMT